MKVVLLSGTVPNDTVLPKFSDVFPTLIEPQKVRVYDSFNRAGLLGGSTTDVGGKLWGSVGTNPATVADVDGGYAESASTTVTIDSGLSDCEIYLKLRLSGTASTVGSRFRFASGANTWECVIWRASNAITLTKIVGGVSTQVATYPITIISNKVYELRITMLGPAITVACDGVVLGSVSDSAHSGNTHHGLYASATGYRWLEFAVGTL